MRVFGRFLREWLLRQAPRLVSRSMLIAGAGALAGAVLLTPPTHAQVVEFDGHAAYIPLFGEARPGLVAPGPLPRIQGQAALVQILNSKAHMTLDASTGTATGEVGLSFTYTVKGRCDDNVLDTWKLRGTFDPKLLVGTPVQKRIVTNGSAEFTRSVQKGDAPSRCLVDEHFTHPNLQALLTDKKGFFVQSNGIMLHDQILLLYTANATRLPAERLGSGADLGSAPQGLIAGLEGAAKPTRAMVVSVTGDVELIREGKSIPLRPDTELREGDRIYTGMESTAVLRFPDATVTVLELTDTRIDNLKVPLADQLGTRLWLKAGEVAAEVEPRKLGDGWSEFEWRSYIHHIMQLQTPTETLSSLGTRWRVRYDERARLTTIWVTEGQVEVTPKNPRLRPFILSAGEQATVGDDAVEGPRPMTRNDRDPARPGEGEGTGSGRAITADRREVRQGEVTRIYVRLKNPGGVANMNYEVRYDPAVVRPEGEPLAGNLLRGRAIFEANPNERGRIRIGFAGPDGLDQDGTVAVIPFRATGRPGTRTALTLATPVIHDAQGRTLSITRVDGAIEIPGEGPGPGGPGPGGPGPGPQKPEPPPLDCDGNQKLTAVDGDCALEMSVGKKRVNSVADIDGDGEVTSGDARILIQRYRDQVRTRR